MPEQQQSMEDIVRRRRVERVRKAAARLEPVEQALTDAQARLPALQRELADIRATIEQALAGQDEEEDDDGGD